MAGRRRNEAPRVDHVAGQPECVGPDRCQLPHLLPATPDSAARRIRPANLALPAAKRTPLIDAMHSSGLCCGESHPVRGNVKEVRAADRHSSGGDGGGTTSSLGRRRRSKLQTHESSATARSFLLASSLARLRLPNNPTEPSSSLPPRRSPYLA